MGVLPMPEALSNVFRRHCKPLAPMPTGETPTLSKLPGIRAVLFDVYGTLFISASGDVGTTKELACELALVEALQAVGVAATDPTGQGVELLAGCIAASHAESHKAGIESPEVDIVAVWRQVLGELAPNGVIEPLDARAVDPRRLAVEYEARANPCWPMPGIRDCLEHLRGRELLLGIVSNAQFYVLELFEALLDGPPEVWGFQRDLQFYSYRHGRAKPGTALFEAAVGTLRRRGVAAAEVLYVGNDMLNDVFPARQVGFRTALFAGDARSLRRRTESPQVDGISPDLVVTDLSQLPDTIIV